MKIEVFSKETITGILAGRGCGMLNCSHEHQGISSAQRGAILVTKRDDIFICDSLTALFSGGVSKFDIARSKKHFFY